VKIDGKKLSNPGYFKKSFTVKTNDPQNRQFVLAVEGTVVKVFDVSSEIVLGGFADEDLKTETVITNQMSTPINITGARWLDNTPTRDLDQKIGIKLETLEKGKKYRLKIWKKKELAPANFTTSILLTTDFAKLKEKRIPVAIMIRNDIEVQPSRVIYGEMVVPSGSSKTFDRVFNVFAVRGDSLKILKVVPNRSDMKVKMEEITPGKTYRGTISVTPHDKIVPYLGSIKIYTNYPRSREIDLDVVGSVRWMER
jgi:hypothetical protein